MPNQVLTQPSVLPVKAAMVAGTEAMDCAKMMGMTPDMFTFMGRWLLWPPYILRPTTRLAYWTGMRRSASLTKTIRTMIAIAPRNISTATHQRRLPLAMLRMLVKMAVGKREMMLANRIMEMPLPMPNSVICSPSHMISAEPEVKVRMMTIAAQTLPSASAVRMP